ncbi:MAG: chromosome segregation protein SMC [SAR324 cluster bacterium]|nr:chromosome segregation protein SMC [SAR324 cluster bacterium]
MQILKLRFKNLNSLVGEWEIDFTHPAYMSDGLFAIFGPTGSGKTTLLDALCLALYGRTPRLSRINKSGNEILARQTGECFAEVEFKTAKGHFRSHWSHHRARKSPLGDLQTPKHEIVDVKIPKVLESSLSKVVSEVESVTGMDFDRFTRAVLLAQGSFAAFLQAKPDERAPLLEQITGTEIYSRISMQVHARQKEEEGILKEIIDKMAAMQMLKKEEEQAIQEQWKTRSSEAQSLEQKLQESTAAVRWHETLETLQNEITALEKDFQNIEKKKSDAEPKRTLLLMAEKALTLELDYNELKNLRKLQNDEFNKLQNALKRTEKLKTEQIQAEENKRKIRLELELAQKAQQNGGELIKQIRILDVQIDQVSSHNRALKAAVKEAETEKLTSQQNLKLARRNMESACQTLEGIECFLREHQIDEGLVENLAGIQEQFALLKVKQESLKKQGELKEEAQKNFEDQENSCQKQQSKLNSAILALQQKEEMQKEVHEELSLLLNGREIADWREETDTQEKRKRIFEKMEETLLHIEDSEKSLAEEQTLLENEQKLLSDLTIRQQNLVHDEKQCEMEAEYLEKEVALLRQIRGLEEERERLSKGQPCPLCGSIDHPYATDHPPQPDQAENKLKDVQNLLKNLRVQINEMVVKFTKTQKNVEHAEKEIRFVQSKIQEGNELYQQYRQSVYPDLTTDHSLEQLQELLTRNTENLETLRDKLKTAEAKTKTSENARKALEHAKEDLGKEEIEYQKAFSARESASKEQKKMNDDFQHQQKEVQHSLAAVSSILKEYGTEKVNLENIDEVFNGLKKRRDTWKEKQQQKAEETNRRYEADGEQKKWEGILLQSTEQWQQQNQTCQENSKILKTMQEQRRIDFSEKNPDDEEARLARAAEDARSALEAANQESASLEQHLKTEFLNSEDLRQSIGDRAENLQTMETSFSNDRLDAGFETEEDYLNACLPRNQRMQLRTHQEELEKLETELQARRREKVESLQKEQAQQVTEQPKSSLQSEMQLLGEKLTAIREEIGALQQKLKDNQEKGEQQKEFLKQKELQNKECTRWNQLHQLIGSADGKKFRNFAQGLTFEVMVKHANQQLQKMSDRYLLIRDSEEPLELNVMDHYQAGLTRSIKNLSGGESFIVSLALALGLSGMTSRNIRVDSLFLDEGFGTLDDEALDTALATLASLQHEGKLIGIISHISELKERIATQIELIPGSNGKSIMQGPGCSSPQEDFKET